MFCCWHLTRLLPLFKKKNAADANSAQMQHCGGNQPFEKSLIIKHLDLILRQRDSVFVFDMNRVMGSHKPNKGTLWLVKRLATKAHHINIMYEDAKLNIPDLFCVCVSD